MDPIVELQNGFIRGVMEKHEDGFNYYAFKGIPYGKPPLGELKFKEPVPADNWSGVLDCRSYGPIGVQHDHYANCDFYNEDCLNLNVYTRSIIDPQANNPVIVAIYTQDFNIGAANDVFFGPDYLIRKNIVLITVNFRKGVLGFLNLEDEIAPGNQGLKDILMALQWIQRNIQVFGGDRNNVTLHGIVGGGVIAHFLSLSPLAKSLMHKIIIQDIVIYNPWTFVSNPKSIAIKFCSILGKNLEDSTEIIEFLKTVDNKQLLEAQNTCIRIMDVIPFGPGVDDKSLNPVMPISQYIAAEQGVHLPCLVGHTGQTGIVLLSDGTRKDYFDVCNLDFDKMVRFGLERFLDSYNLNKAQLKQLYYKNETISENNLKIFVEFQTELQFIQAIHKFVKIQVEQSSTSTYLYRFNYDPQDSLSRTLMKDKPPGASSLDDLPYLFKMGLYGKLGGQYFLKNTRNYKMMEQMTEMWTNFATYGRPTVATSNLLPVHWLPLNNGKCLRYLNIDENLTMESTLNLEEKFLSAKDIKV